MANHTILIDTANLYSRRAEHDASYALPSTVLNTAIKQMGLTEEPSVTEISNAGQYIVVRTQATEEEPELIRHPLDYVEKGITAGIEALKNQGMLDTEHVCLIAVPRSSLTSTFTHIYEVVRRCNWSVLPLGGSVDSEDISQLCNAYGVDTLFIAADALDLVFSSDMAGQFDGVKNILYVSGTPPQTALDRIKPEFSQLQIHPFLYQSNIIGPIGLPTQGDGSNEFDVLENILVEVETPEGEIALNGSGRLLISVLGLEQPTLIRRDIGDSGVLTTDDEGRQVLRLDRWNAE